MSSGDAIALAVAAFGWGATHVFSEGRERRKETRLQIDKIHEHLVNVEIDARVFHTAVNFDLANAGKTLAGINLLERLLMRVSILSMDRLHPYIIGINRACTLRNFDASSFKQLSYYDDILQSITGAVQDMEDELERQYRQKYSSIFSYILAGVKGS